LKEQQQWLRRKSAVFVLLKDIAKAFNVLAAV